LIGLGERQVDIHRAVEGDSELGVAPAVVLVQSRCQEGRAGRKQFAIAGPDGDGLLERESIWWKALM